MSTQSLGPGCDMMERTAGGAAGMRQKEEMARGAGCGPGGAEGKGCSAIGGAGGGLGGRGGFISDMG